jgi:hypothetical protein
LFAGATVGSSRRAAVSYRRHKSPVTGLAEMAYGLRPSGSPSSSSVVQRSGACGGGSGTGIQHSPRSREWCSELVRNSASSSSLCLSIRT